MAWARIGILASSVLVASAGLATAIEGDGSNDAASAQFNLVGCRDFLASPVDLARRWAAWVCLGKVLTLEAYSMFLTAPLRACTFKSAPPALLVKAVVDHIEAHPSRWQEPFSTLALEALAQTWPCPTGSAP